MATQSNLQKLPPSKRAKIEVRKRKYSQKKENTLLLGCGFCLLLNSQNRQKSFAFSALCEFQHKKMVRDICKVNPGSMENVGKGVMCCDTRLCAMRAAREVGIDA